MRESTIEKAITQFAERRGWLSYKWASPAHRGVPDRLFFRHGILVIVEFKAPGKKPTKLQNYVHKQLNDAGFEVLVIDSLEKGFEVFRAYS